MNTPTTFSLLVTSNAFSTDRHELAMRFVEAAALQGHSIQRVFFYQDAVNVANQNQTPPQGQASPCTRWAELAEKHQFPLIACIANSLRRGLADTAESARHDLTGANLHPAFSLAGLGEMAESYNDSDQLVQF